MGKLVVIDEIFGIDLPEPFLSINFNDTSHKFPPSNKIHSFQKSTKI
jgi:hypothetical protein